MTGPALLWIALAAAAPAAEPPAPGAPVPAAHAPPSVRGGVLDPERVGRHVLENGLVVLTLEDHSVPVVTFGTAFRVGSRNERPGITGISHLFEHMMFNGAARYGRKQYDAVLEAAGGYSNAYTSNDVTYYYEVAPSDRLELLADLDSDRLESLVLDDEVLAAEREVVKEERLRSENDPAQEMDELLQALSYLSYPYRWPVIGWRGDLDAIRTPDLTEYFRTHYHAGNAVIAIAGDFDTGEALALVRRWFGRLPSGTRAPEPVDAEPEPRGDRRARLRRDAELPAIEVGWRAPSVSARDFPAAEVLRTVLAQGDSSRLFRRLVDTAQIATDVQAYYEWRLGPGLFAVYAQARPGHEVAPIEAAILEETSLLRREEIPEEELRKAKRVFRAELLRRLKTNEGRAEALASSEVLLGDCRKLFELPDRIDALTAAQVRDAARRLFRPDARATVVLVPTSPKAADAEVQDGGGR